MSRRYLPNLKKVQYSISHSEKTVSWKKRKCKCRTNIVAGTPRDLKKFFCYLTKFPSFNSRVSRYFQLKFLSFWFFLEKKGIHKNFGFKKKIRLQHNRWNTPVIWQKFNSYWTNFYIISVKFQYFVSRCENICSLFWILTKKEPQINTGSHGVQLIPFRQKFNNFVLQFCFLIRLTFACADVILQYILIHFLIG